MTTKTPSQRITIGLMSGTSLDGEDAVMVRFGPENRMSVLGHAYLPFDEALAHELLSLALGGGPDEIERMGDASVALARHGAAVVDLLLERTGLPRDAVDAIGSHGQTIRHRPERGFTIQLNHPALLAERTGIDVVADFRSRDVAAGGEGAPLVPAFHAEIFGDALPTAVLNIGGIANVTLVPPKGSAAPVTGFDTGPGNMLLDHWMRMHFDRPYDEEGRTAASGRINAAWLAHLEADPYFALPSPKSTGREYFSPAWLEKKLDHPSAAGLRPEDGAATLTELTARTAADAALAAMPTSEPLQRFFVCGGGALNPVLMRALEMRLREKLGSAAQALVFGSTKEAGLDPMMVEGAAFAWLARAFLERGPGNLPAVTHAKGPRILGALYPAG